MTKKMWKFPNRIKELRKKHNISQEDFANCINLSRTHLSHIETLYSMPTLPLAYKISKFFNLPIEEVFQLDQMETINKLPKLKYETIEEEDGSCTLELVDIDLLVNSKTKKEGVQKLAKDLLEYAKEYKNELTLYKNAPNRKDHYPIILRVLAQENLENIAEMLQEE